MKYLLACLPLLTACMSSPALPPITCGQDVVNKPVDATQSLQACFDSGSPEISLPPGIYTINGIIDLTGHNDLTIETLGLNEMAASCLEASSPICAVLQAPTTSINPTILKIDFGANIAFNHIALDGNKSNRLHLYDGTQLAGYNAIVHNCIGCSFYGFASHNAMRNSGMEFSGDNATFERVSFRDNGISTVVNPDSLWSDGLTILTSANIVISNSIFIDNSDVNLILGNAPNSLISNNQVGNINTFAFGGLMINNFSNSTNGDFTGALITNNTINCDQGMCGVSLMLGSHIWSTSLNDITGGNVTNNTVTQGKFGIVIAGASGTTVSDNTILSSGEYAPIYNANCVGVAFALESGDNVMIEGNNIQPTSLEYKGCNANVLPDMVQTGG